jgi:hypothetical protein
MIVAQRILSIIAIIAGGYFIGVGTQWQIGLGAALLTWASLPSIPND